MYVCCPVAKRRSVEKVTLVLICQATSCKRWIAVFLAILGTICAAVNIAFWSQNIVIYLRGQFYTQVRVQHLYSRSAEADVTSNLQARVLLTASLVLNTVYDLATSVILVRSITRVELIR